jgi:hypothetical protein
VQPLLSVFYTKIASPKCKYMVVFRNVQIPKQNPPKTKVYELIIYN